MPLLNRFAVLSFLLLPMSFFSQNIPAAEASKHVGESGTVCGRIAETYTASSSRGIPTFIDFEKPYPNQAFTAVVWQRDRAEVGDVPRTGVLCVTGIIIQPRGRLQIVLHNPSDWSIPSSHVSPSPAPHKSEPQLSNDNHYTNTDGVVVHSPAYSSGGVPTGATAQCGDGTFSFSQHRQGTCSHHGGVAKWL